jgi:hypothetical protein
MEEHKLKLNENKVLRGILGPNKDEVIEKLRILKSENIRDLYRPPSIYF